MRNLTSRERVVKALNHEEPDLVPIDLGGGAASMSEVSYYRLKEYLKIKGDEGTVISDIFTIRNYDERVLKNLDIDFRRVYLKTPERTKPKLRSDGIWRDEWGIIYKKVGYYAEAIANPLANSTIKDLQKWNWPDPYDPERIEGLEKEVQDLYYNSDYAIVAGHVVRGLFQQCLLLRGMEQFLSDMLLDEEFANRLLEKVTDITIDLFDTYLSIVGKYIQMVQIQDDLGTQVGLLISPSLYRKLVKPQHKRLVDFIKKKTNAKVFLHSDGSVYELIEDFIECGIDVLNPIQPSAKNMEAERLKKEFGDRLSFHGGIDVQQVLPQGTVQDVEEEVRKQIRILALGGGYILAASQNIQPDVPPENVVAMFRAARQYGRYPIIS